MAVSELDSAWQGIKDSPKTGVNLPPEKPAYTDTLSLMYPRYAGAIQAARGAGYSEEEIGGYFDGLEQKAALHYPQMQIDRHFQRTDKDMAAVSDYNRKSRIYGYYQALDGKLTQDEIVERMDAARRTGLKESLLMTDDGLYARVKKDIIDAPTGEGWLDYLNRAILWPLGISAGKMAGNYALGGGAQVLGQFGKMKGKADQLAYEHLAPMLKEIGVPEEETKQFFSEENNVPRELARAMLGLNAKAQKGLDEYRRELVGDRPELATRLAEGVGSSIGFMLTGILAAITGNLSPTAARVAGALAMGTSEALTESGDLLTEAYEGGLYDEGLEVAGQSFGANMALNSTLNLLAGRFSPLMQYVPAGWMRRGMETAGEVVQEAVLQEPLQGVIENAAKRTLLGGGNFYVNLLEAVKEYPQILAEIGPETAGSTLITQLLFMGLGAADSGEQAARTTQADIDMRAQAETAAETAQAQTETETAQTQTEAAPVAEQAAPETQAEGAAGTAPQEGTQPEAPAHVFIPRAALESYAQEATQPAPQVLQTLGITPEAELENGEVMISLADFERLEREAPEFVKRIAPDVRRGAKGLTTREAADIIRRKASADPMWHSGEVTQLRRDLTKQMVDAGRPRKEANAFANLATSFAVTTARRAGVSVGEVMNIAIRQAEEATGTGEGYEQRMFHGTRHNLGGRFDLTKIGTGEGAQAYGWGLYFAENRGVSESYRTAGDSPELERFIFTGLDGKTYKYNEKTGLVGNFLYQLAMNEDMRNMGLDVPSLQDKAKSLIDIERDNLLFYQNAMTEEKRPQYLAELKEAVAITEANIAELEANTPVSVTAAPGTIGNLYTVEGPENADLLDWDAPMTDQPEKVKEAIKAAKAEGFLHYDPQYNSEDRLKGNHIYAMLAADLGGYKEASLWLNKHGVPGLRYLDQGSRDAKTGTHNFVVWNEDLLKVMGVEGPASEVEAYNQAQEAQPLLRAESGRSIEEAANSELLTTSDSATALSYIDADAAAAIGISEGEIQANVGALRHIEKQGHGKEIRNAGYDVQPFMLDVLNNWTEIREGADNSIWLVRPLKDKHGGVAAIKLDNIEDGVYRVSTLMYMRERGIKNRKLLYARHPATATSHGPDVNLTRATPSKSVEYAAKGEYLSEEQSSEQSLQQDGRPVNGRTSFLRPESAEASVLETKSLIEFFQTANASTGFHELAHHMFRVLVDLSTIEGVNPEIYDDVETVFKNAGITRAEWEADTDRARERAHEFFARSFETYLSEGKAPNAELRGVFQRVRQWLIEVYRDVVQALGIELNDEMRGVFDRLLATPEQIDAETRIGQLALEEAAAREEITRTEAEMRAQAEQDAANDRAAETGWEAPELSEDAVNDVDGWLGQLEDYNLKRNAREYIKEITDAIKDNGGLRLEDFVRELGEELAKELRAKWPGLFRKRKGQVQLELDVLTQQLQAMGIDLDVQGLVDWLQNTINERPKRPAPLVEVNADTLNALIDRLGLEGARDYAVERSRYLRQLQGEIQARYEQDKNNTEVKAELEAAYREQREIAESLKALNRTLKSPDPDRELTENERMGLPEGISDAAEPEEPAPKRRAKQDATLTLADALKRGYAMAEKYAKEAFKAGAEAEREKGRARLDEVRARYDERIEALKDKYGGKLDDAEIKRRLQIQSLKARAEMLKKLQRDRAKVKNEIAKTVRAIDRMARSESISHAAQQDIKELLNGLDLKRRSRREIEHRTDVEVFLQVYPEARGQMTRQELKYLGATALNDMTLGDLRRLHEEVKSRFEQGKREFAEWQANREARRETIREGLTASLDKRKGPKPGVVTGPGDLGKQYEGFRGKLERFKDWAYSIGLTPDRFFDWLDGGRTKYNGAFVKYFVDGINAAVDESKRHEQERLAWMKDELKKLGFKMADFSKKAAEVDGRAYTWNEIMEIYVGMRNEKKAAAILYGNFVNGNGQGPVYTPEQARGVIAELIGKLDENHRKAAELVIQDHEANFDRLNGRLIQVFNKGMEHELDYTSIHRLERQTQDGLIDVNDEQAMERGLDETGILKRLELGFMRSRQEIADEHQAPVTLGLFSNWMNDVSRHERAAAMAEIAGDLTGALLSRGEDGRPLIKTLQDRFGGTAKKVLVSFFNDSVTDGQRLACNFLDGMSNYFARNMSVAYIAGNLGTVLKQTTSIPRFLITAGPVRLLMSTARFLTQQTYFLEHVYELDPQMRDRGGNALMNAIQQDPNWGKRAYERGLGWIFAPVSIVDRWVAAIGWQATYDANIAKGLSHEAAVREAQRAVRLTQQASEAKDLPRAWRNGGYLKLAMAFTSDTAATLGMTAYDLAQQLSSREWNTTKKAFSTALALTVTAMAMKAASGGLWGDDDDDEGFDAWLGSALTEEFISSLPLIGKEAMMLYEEMSGKYHGTQYSAFLTPVVKFCKAVKLFTDEDSEGEEFWRASGYLLDSLALSGIAPVPATAIRRTIQSIAMAGTDGGAAAANLFGIRVKQEGR